MKTILWATLSANGNYASSNAEHPPKQEALMDFAQQAKLSGNFISGRKTFEGFRASGATNMFSGLDIVVVSEKSEAIDGVKVVRSPKEAIEFLKSKGHKISLFTGGETLHNSVLAQNLADEVIFNFAPVFESEGMNLVLPKGEYKDVSLIEMKNLGSGVVQLRYAMQK